VDKVLLITNHLAVRKNITILYKHSDFVVEADSNRIVQVLSILITNSIKLTPIGGVVEVLIHEVNYNIRITVKDNGIGMSEKIMKDIFQKIDRLTVSTRKGTDGEKGLVMGCPYRKSFLWPMTLRSILAAK